MLASDGAVPGGQIQSSLVVKDIISDGNDTVNLQASLLKWHKTCLVVNNYDIIVYR